MSNIIKLFFVLMILWLGIPSFPLFAEKTQDLLSIERRAKQGKTVTGVVRKDPLVFIGDTVTNEPKDKKSKNTFVPTPVDWKAPSKKIKIKTPFNRGKEVPYIEHIPYMFVTIQVLGDGKVYVTEDIQLIVQSNSFLNEFKRIYNTTLLTPQGAYKRAQRSFLRGKYNGNVTTINVFPLEDQGKEEVSFSEAKNLSSGLHIFQLSYVISSAFIKSGEMNQLFISLLGSSIPLPVERLSGVLSVPTSTKLIKQELLFGENNLTVENASDVLSDETGHVAFKTQKLLPPQADVRLNVLMAEIPKASIPKIVRLNNFILDTLVIWISLIAGMFICLYYWIEVWIFLHTKENKKMRQKVLKKLAFHPELIRYALFKKADARMAGALLTGLVQKGSVLLSIAGTGKLRVQPASTPTKLRKAEAYILSNLFPTAEKKEVFFNPSVFQNNLDFQKIVQFEYLKQYTKVIAQELFSGWIVGGICLAALFLLNVSFFELFLSAVFLSICIFIGSYFFITKATYPILIRKFYQAQKEHLEAVLRDKSEDSKIVIQKNISILIALDVVRPLSEEMDVKVKFPLGKLNDTMSLTLVDNIVTSGG